VDEPNAEERLFNLVLALLATTAGLTKSQILETVNGYRQRWEAGGQAVLANLERQFERDKESLRTLGIPIEAFDDPGDPGNNQRTRYMIPRASYELPADVAFTAEELALLGLAATVWRDGSLSEESRRALTKLRGLGITPAEPVIGFLPLVRTLDPALEPLRQAVDARVVVEFDYLKPGEEEPTHRRVSALALVNHEGRWHLIAAEPDGTRKTFLLRRIVSGVAVTKSPGIPPEPDEDRRALELLRALWDRQTARVEVAPGSDAWVRLGNRPGTREVSSGILELRYTDVAILADELLPLHPEVLALEPRALVERITSRFEALEAAHG